MHCKNNSTVINLINNKISLEKTCIDDLLIELKLHQQADRFEKALEVNQDIGKSLKSITRLFETLEKSRQRRKLISIVNSLSKQGIVSSTVKRSVIEIFDDIQTFDRAN